MFPGCSAYCTNNAPCPQANLPTVLIMPHVPRLLCIRPALSLRLLQPAAALPALPALLPPVPVQLHHGQPQHPRLHGSLGLRLLGPQPWILHIIGLGAGLAARSPACLDSHRDGEVIRGLAIQLILTSSGVANDCDKSIISRKI